MKIFTGLGLVFQKAVLALLFMGIMPFAHARDSVALVKEWYDAGGNKLATPPALSKTVTILMAGSEAWMKIIYPAGDTAHPIITSAFLKPAGAGSSWPAEVSAVFNSTSSVTANSTKDLSNVVLLFADGSEQKFDNLKGYSKTFSGTGANAGKTVVGVWIKSGSNKSDDGPGYGSYVGRTLMVSGGSSYTVTETGLPDGWSCRSGLGTFTSNGGSDTHTVKNQATQNQTPAVTLVKTAGTALDGEVYTLNGAHIVTYTYRVSNTGFTFLKNLVVTDDKLGAIGTVAGPIAPGSSAVLTMNAMVPASVTNTGTVVATPSTQAGDPIFGQATVSDTDPAVVAVLAPVTHEFVAIIKEWYDADGNLMLTPPNLSTTVTITATAAKAWSTAVFPAGSTANPISTSAVLKPDGAGIAWPDEVSATFSSTSSVTANSTKSLSNVVLKFADGTEQKFDSLTGYTGTFSGTGANTGKAIVGIWVKSGDNASGDGPGFGSYIGRALMISEGVSYTVTENGLPEGWSCESGLGTFTSNGGSDAHTVKNRMNPAPIPGIRLVKTAGAAPDGTELTLEGPASVTYTFLVQNTGNTWLKDLVVTDDKIGAIGTVAGPLAPWSSATLTATVAVAADVTNMGTVTGDPCSPAGADIGLPPVTDTDDAYARLKRLSMLGDYVWLDANANGLQDEGEVALEGVTARLCDGSGNALGPVAVTAANGGYWFADLLPGTYTVRFEKPEGYVFSPNHEGDDDAVDSDADESTGLTPSVTLTEGMTNLTLDAGMWQPQPAVSLVKTAGTAADGDTFTIMGAGSVTYTYVVKNTGNTWLKDLAVTDDKIGDIGTVDGLLGPGVESTLTKSVTVSANVTNLGTVSGTPSTPHGDMIPDQEDVSDSDPAVVVVLPLDLPSLGDRVWVDANRNGVQDAGEVGLSGVGVTLLDAGGATVASAVTGSDGRYLFTDLAAGDYRVRFVLPTTNWHFVAQDQGADDGLDSDANPADGLTALITLAYGQDDLTWDAGVYGGLPPGFCDQMTVGENFNALIFGDFTAVGGDTEGRLAVAGTANLSPGYSVGLTVMGKVIPPVNGAADMLIVGGDLYEPGNYADINGNVVYGGTRTGPEKYMGSNTIRQVVPVTLDANGNVPDDGSGAPFAFLHQQLFLASAMIASMDDRGVVEKELDKVDHIISFVGNDAVLNVFNVDASDWSGSQMDILINTPADSTVVFNIHGSRVELSNGAIRLTGVQNDRILFNYADATNIITSGFTHEGAVLAPRAGGSFSGGAFEGFGFFGGSVTTTNGFEFHHFPFRGNLCSEADASPALTLATTAGDAANGAVLTVLGGSDVTVSYRVTNTGNTWLEHVSVTDDLLGVIGSIDYLLAPGASVTLAAVLPNVSEDKVLRGTATGRPVRQDGTRWNGYADVSVADSASIKIGSPAAVDNPYAAWQRADFAVTGLEFIDAPTLTGEVFSVRVTVDNHGDFAADGGRLTLYLSKPAYVSEGEQGDVSKAVGVLRPGESKTFTFQNLTAGSKAGVQHLRAYVDSLNGVQEWSEGDNQLSAVYDLNPIYLNIAATPYGSELSWNSFGGQYYTLYRCTDLSKGFLMFKSRVEATPPVNTFLDIDPADMRFYRLVVEQK
ncbi:MAG: SdrD B-like domain-containing protein [Kiritimatiellia bacterium]